MRVNLAVLLVLVLSVCTLTNATAQEADKPFLWKHVGAEPNELGMGASLSSLGLDGLGNHVDFENYNYTQVYGGMRFDAMNFGNGKVRRNVLADFDGSYNARVWRVPAISTLNVYKVDACGNFAYTQSFEPLEDSEALKDMIDTRVSQAVGNAMRDHMEAENHGHGWLWFWIIVALILGLIALLRRGRKGEPGKPGKKGDPGDPGKKGDAGECKCPAPAAVTTATSTETSSGDSDDETGESPTLDEIHAALTALDQRRVKVLSDFAVNIQEKGKRFAEVEALIAKLKKFLGITEESVTEPADTTKTPGPSPGPSV